MRASKFVGWVLPTSIVNFINTFLNNIGLPSDYLIWTNQNDIIFSL